MDKWNDRWIPLKHRFIDKGPDGIMSCMGEQHEGPDSFATQCRLLVEAASETSHVVCIDELLKAPSLAPNNTKEATTKLPTAFRNSQRARPDSEMSRWRLRGWLLALRFTIALKVYHEQSDGDTCCTLFDEICEHHGFSDSPGSRAFFAVLAKSDVRPTLKAQWFFEQVSTDESWPQEMLGLCLYLLNLKSGYAASGPTVSITVLGDDNGEGFFATMQFEKLSSGSGYIRHALSYLLPTDDSFEKSFEDVYELLTNDEKVPQSDRWSGGSIRWHLTSPKRLVRATGDSLGGAIGVGTILSLKQQQADLKVSITAKVNRRGGLEPVDGMAVKLNAFKQFRGKTVLLWPNHPVPGICGDGLTIIGPKDIFAAAKMILIPGRTENTILPFDGGLGHDTTGLRDSTPILIASELISLNMKKRVIRFSAPPKSDSLDSPDSPPEMTRNSDVPFHCFHPASTPKQSPAIIPVLRRLKDWMLIPRQSVRKYITACKSLPRRCFRSKWIPLLEDEGAISGGKIIDATAIVHVYAGEKVRLDGLDGGFRFDRYDRNFLYASSEDTQIAIAWKSISQIETQRSRDS